MATENFNDMQEVEIRQRIDSILPGDYGWPAKTMMLPLDGDDAMMLLRGLMGDPDAAGEAIEYITDSIASLDSIDRRIAAGGLK